ncbi:MAG TPA: DUF1772 domain-containing protein [Burkholderiales bacterium]|jgi:hypothetical protein|nr:DUF1772 domain-containing protein [Burkholderiales bacterium]
MALKVARFLSLLFVALALAPAMAHLLELPNKIGLSRDEYLTVQHIYNGWALLGFVVYSAIFSTLALALLTLRRRGEFGYALTAFLCLVGTQVVFWWFTFPANRATANWTVLPDNWIALRTQWEYSHAASAVLDLVALLAVMLAVLRVEREA